MIEGCFLANCDIRYLLEAAVNFLALKLLNQLFDNILGAYTHFRKKIYYSLFWIANFFSFANRSLTQVINRKAHLNQKDIT